MSSNVATKQNSLLSHVIDIIYPRNRRGVWYLFIIYIILICSDIWRTLFIMARSGLIFSGPWSLMMMIISIPIWIGYTTQLIKSEIMKDNCNWCGYLLLIVVSLGLFVIMPNGIFMCPTVILFKWYVIIYLLLTVHL